MSGAARIEWAEQQRRRSTNERYIWHLLLRPQYLLRTCITTPAYNSVSDDTYRKFTLTPAPLLLPY